MALGIHRRMLNMAAKIHDSEIPETSDVSLEDLNIPTFNNLNFDCPFHTCHLVHSYQIQQHQLQDSRAAGSPSPNLVLSPK